LAKGGGNLLNELKFDYLIGSIDVPAIAPENWKKEGLSEFYQNPNNPKWGSTICRWLYHESVHFWQFLSSGYMANLVATEWNRLIRFKETGEIDEISSTVIEHGKKRGNPFSAGELVECIARFWDVHTRNPVEIIKDEEIKVETSNLLERQSFNKQTDYSNIAFDTVMQKGKDCESYAEPYRWMLSQTEGNSYFAALLLPAVAHFAFGNPYPVTVFCNAFETACKSHKFHEEVEKHKTGSINIDWVQFWLLIKEIVDKEFQRPLPSFTTGLQVISRGPLKTHPIYREYLVKASSLVLRLNLPFTFRKDLNIIEEKEAQFLIDHAKIDPGLVYGLPGQPVFRYLLGSLVPPPSIKFENFMYYSDRPVVFRNTEINRGINAEATYKGHSKVLEDQVRQFRQAEYAVSLGLDPKHFINK
jgi:hypothetical protein